MLSIPVYKENLASQPREETYRIYLKFTLDIRVLKYRKRKGNISISVAAHRDNVKKTEINTLYE
jgi:hypothetical protein